MKLGAPIAIFRIFDEQLAREFYIDFMEFEVEFEHRFDANAPLYMGLRRDEFRLHLSGHFGDASPGARVYVPSSGLKELSKTLRAKSYKHARPGPPEKTPWGTLELTLNDPFGNRITFAEE